MAIYVCMYVCNGHYTSDTTRLFASHSPHPKLESVIVRSRHGISPDVGIDMHRDTSTLRTPLFYPKNFYNKRNIGIMWYVGLKLSSKGQGCSHTLIWVFDIMHQLTSGHLNAY